MRRRHYLLIIIAIMFCLTAITFLIISKQPPVKPEPPGPETNMRVPPDKQLPGIFDNPEAAATEAQSTSGGDPTAQTDASTEKESKAEELDFFKTFSDFPKMFVSHGVRPGEQMTSEFYYDAELEISENGKIKGTYFSNLDSTDDMTIESRSSWSAEISGKKVYRDANGNYYFCLKNVKYDKKPGSTEESDGKIINYVYGYGLNKNADNKIKLYAPDTAIKNIPTKDPKTDIRNFLSLMRKSDKNGKLDCFLIIGKDDSCYVSLTDEEIEMAKSGDDTGENEPSPPPGQPGDMQQPPQP